MPSFAIIEISIIIGIDRFVYPYSLHIFNTHYIYYVNHLYIIIIQLPIFITIIVPLKRQLTMQ